MHVACLSLYHQPATHGTVRGYQFINLCLDLCLSFGAFRQVVVVLENEAVKVTPRYTGLEGEGRRGEGRGREGRGREGRRGGVLTTHAMMNPSTLSGR